MFNRGLSWYILSPIGQLPRDSSQLTKDGTTYDLSLQNLSSVTTVSLKTRDPKDPKRRLSLLDEYPSSDSDADRKRTCWQHFFKFSKPQEEIDVTALGLPSWVSPKSFTKNYESILMAKITQIGLHIANFTKPNKKQLIRNNICWHLNQFLIIELAIQFVDIRLLTNYKKAFQKAITAFNVLASKKPDVVDCNF